MSSTRTNDSPPKIKIEQHACRAPSETKTGNADHRRRRRIKFQTDTTFRPTEEDSSSEEEIPDIKCQCCQKGNGLEKKMHDGSEQCAAITKKQPAAIAKVSVPSSKLKQTTNVANGIPRDIQEARIRYEGPSTPKDDSDLRNLGSTIMRQRSSMSEDDKIETSQNRPKRKRATTNTTGTHRTIDLTRDTTTRVLLNSRSRPANTIPTAATRFSFFPPAANSPPMPPSRQASSGRPPLQISLRDRLPMSAVRDPWDARIRELQRPKLAQLPLRRIESTNMLRKNVCRTVSQNIISRILRLRLRLISPDWLPRRLSGMTAKVKSESEHGRESTPSEVIAHTELYRIRHPHCPYNYDFAQAAAVEDMQAGHNLVRVWAKLRQVQSLSPPLHETEFEASLRTYREYVNKHKLNQGIVRAAAIAELDRDGDVPDPDLTDVHFPADFRSLFPSVVPARYRISVKLWREGACICGRPHPRVGDTAQTAIQVGSLSNTPVPEGTPVSKSTASTSLSSVRKRKSFSKDAKISVTPKKQKRTQ
ncbi:hypothetical protein Dda_7124 [Drechslerella dactyloides]|uniref:Uncharacterized protein n=1 Tax=Drechslerella dactyloides TaxID=74499 RepID=A0AAD6NH65_DREDA|nr:hypothetical protein Dda_7124 [Drechslerella dactyloides]